ncbi:MAG: helix-turn-helix domain-containing protein [Sphingobacteriales bacterium]|nr:MAG: helix-turn-helix domain-containing protein [Sphingobacteriales bacterium]
MNLEQKEVLTLTEVSSYTGLSKSHIYKLCSTGGIPFYKPFGKVNYFDRLEIISWLKQNRIATNKELESQASTFVTLKNGGAK